MSETPRNQKKDSITRDISILVVITLAAGLLLGAAYSVTKGPIERAKARAEEEARREVMPDADAFESLMRSEEPDEDGSGEEAALPEAVAHALEQIGLTNTSVDQIDLALDAEEEPMGWIVTCTNSEGYGGDVGLMCGISEAKDGSLTIEGISFLELTETAGMGMRAKESSFTEQFSGKVIREGESLAYTKDGAAKENEIDAISGCTITTTAVTKDVNAAVEAVRVLLASPELSGDGQEEQEG